MTQIEFYICSLWFNSSKDTMRRRLKNPNDNSGVGISVPDTGDFTRDTGKVTLIFDDSTTGSANVDKASFFSGCCHLIDNSIGQWARQNNLWARKMRSGYQRVIVYLRPIEKGKTYAVFRQKPKED